MRDKIRETAHAITEYTTETSNFLKSYVFEYVVPASIRRCGLIIDGIGYSCISTLFQ